MKNKTETRGRKPGKYYVSNEELVREIKIYNETGVFTDTLGEYIKKIVDGISHMPNYINYFKEGNPWGTEMYSDAIWRISKSVIDGSCKIIPDDQIGLVQSDENDEIIYKVDDDGEFIYDENDEKIEMLTEQNNVFGYFTRTAWNAFNGRLKKEKKDKEKLEEHRNKVFLDYEIEHGIAHREDNEFKTENDW